MDPPVETFFTVYQFNVTNPEAVLSGAKPKLAEVGPYVYRSKVVQDRVEWSQDFQQVRCLLKGFVQRYSRNLLLHR